MNNRILILVMLALGVSLGINPYTSKINTGLFKGTTWLFSGIMSKLLK